MTLVRNSSRVLGISNGKQPPDRIRAGGKGKLGHAFEDVADKLDGWLRVLLERKCDSSSRVTPSPGGRVQGNEAVAAHARPPCCLPQPDQGKFRRELYTSLMMRVLQLKISLSRRFVDWRYGVQVRSANAMRANPGRTGASACMPHQQMNRPSVAIIHHPLSSSDIMPE